MINKLRLDRSKFYDIDYANKSTLKKNSHFSPKQNDNNNNLQYSKDNLSKIF